MLAFSAQARASPSAAASTSRRTGSLRTYLHETGRAVVHLGSRRHGADDIRRGERHNLIIWNVNRAYRERSDYFGRLAAEREGAPPDARCLSYTHDRDFGAFKTYPAGTEHFAHSKAWCPPQDACYESMGRVFSQMRRAEA